MQTPSSSTRFVHCARAFARRSSLLFSLLGTLAALALALPAPALAGNVTKPSVLLVGSYHGVAGQYSSIQAAVDAAKPGDWILVGPGDYHERGDRSHWVTGEAGGGVMVQTPDLHIRGMDRNAVIIDGTKPGSPPCSSDPADQDFGEVNGYGSPVGRNGVFIWKVDGVSVENLTACNFLSGSYGGGNQIWWNGGDGSGQIGMGAYHGAYLSATTTYWQSGEPQAEYGIFVSNADGPGAIVHTYASNMADSGYYIGACPDCNALLLDAHAQNSALGYSGTNSGGHLVIALSEWDHNKTGISTNSQNNGDAPSPQDGSCPNGTGSCTYFISNWIHDNNNPNVPGSGTADFGPVGTGMVVAGGRFDSLMLNRVENNGAWGLLLVPFIDNGTPPASLAQYDCRGGTLGYLGLFRCFYNDFGNEVAYNLMDGNGSFGNETNGDLGDLSDPADPGNCWHDNFDPAGLTTAPANLEQTNGTCGVPNQGASVLGSPLSIQVICNTQIFGPCNSFNYPRRTQVQLMPLPEERSMPNPCAGVPRNPWCPASYSK